MDVNVLFSEAFETRYFHMTRCSLLYINWKLVKNLRYGAVSGIAVDFGSGRKVVNND